MDWLIQNKEWLFSGLGIVFIGAIASIVRIWVLQRHRIKVLAHQAYFEGSLESCVFVKIINLSRNHDIEVTHVWLETNPKVHLLRRERPLPTRILPLQTWETWIEKSLVPHTNQKSLLKLFRVRLSSGETYKSKGNVTVPERGYIAGQAQK